MKPEAILYTSNTGYTRQYAQLLAQATGLPVYALEEAKAKLPDGSRVIYMGWLMAGKVQGYAKAVRRYSVAAVCGVGMGATGSQLQDVQKANALSADMPVFTLQGGFDITRLHGIYKLMMTIMAKTVGKSLAKKENRTSDENAMLELMLHGGNLVREENLKDVLNWVQAEQ